MAEEGYPNAVRMIDFRSAPDLEGSYALAHLALASPSHSTAKPKNTHHSVYVLYTRGFLFIHKKWVGSSAFVKRRIERNRVTLTSTHTQDHPKIYTKEAW